MRNGENVAQHIPESISISEKALALFGLIKELSALKTSPFLNVNKVNWYQAISKIHSDPQNIEIFFRDRVEGDSSDSEDNLLKVHKPEYQPCPEYPEELEQWLLSGWNNFAKEAKVRDSIEYSPEIDSLFDEADTQTVLVEYFLDDKARVSSWEGWKKKRDTWAEKQKEIQQTRNLFSRLYQLHTDLERDSETLEMIVSAGFLKDRDTPDINFPVLTRRVKTSFDADKNTLTIQDADVESELYTPIFQYIADINLGSIEPLMSELRENDYHPLDRNETPEFLKRLVYQLSSDSIFSPDLEPMGWSTQNRLMLYVNPSFIVRKRVDGTIKAVEQIISCISETGYVPPHLCDIVSGGKIDIEENIEEESIEEQLASVGGESVDILLSKEANKEQLEIARRIERYNAVLVQGPPGTGKTHTIANLMGHFLAQGKSILVTSHTKKALTVLKEKVAPGLQDLCVSILEDSNVDMERSIDGITDFMGRHTSYELRKEKELVAHKRKRIISDLAETRKKLFSIINQECNSIVLDGVQISPSKAAAFVLDNAEKLSYIPGNVRLYSPFPLTNEELANLYNSNTALSQSEEAELSCNLPSPSQLIYPTGFNRVQQSLLNAQTDAASIAEKNGWEFSYDPVSDEITLSLSGRSFIIQSPSEDSLHEIEELTKSYGDIEPWMLCVAVDSKKGDAYKNRWLALISQIELTCKYADAVVGESFCKDVSINKGIAVDDVKALIEKLRAHLEKKSKVSKFDIMMNASLEKALHAATINGAQIETVADCNLVLNHIALYAARELCAKYWDTLIAEHGAPSFASLDVAEPERIAEKWIPLISRYLNWYQDEYVLLAQKLDLAHIPADIVFPQNALDSELTATRKMLEAAKNTIPGIVRTCRCALQIKASLDAIAPSISALKPNSRTSSSVCTALLQAINNGNYADYAEAYERLRLLHSKYILQSERETLLNKLALDAPQWAKAIRTREGIHGESTVPDSIHDAWKWKQYHGIIADITAEPYEELQSKSLILSKDYRKITSKYAELCAWEHLLSKTERDIDMKQALQGWKLTVKRIGKGTGKNAPMYRAQARQLMAKCQNAVPAWIMPVNKALESLDPKRNKFDVVIIDEASQSDITALSIAYMAEKLIIVGDDKQVSPMAVGVEVDKMNSLIQMYIQDKIPNAHLYNAKTSLYEIALTSYPPLMLREHFRCVPEIIGFSNALSYDFKIKPLRDNGNSEIIPAVVNYRVANGKRSRKENLIEAMNVVALIKACIKQPEYKGKSFGVISLLGDEQAKRIQLLLSEHIDIAELEKRRIICGNASHFQGDERDIIFLSMVDSHSDDGPLPMQGFGVDDANRKRYNVAASRAKDQLWVVNSLDSTNDLKPDDIRKRLLDYASSPSAFENMLEKIEKESESPFEVSVASSLAARGYHLVQQWKVGAYRIDMVALCGKKKVAIECDGERFHTDVRADMERQAILERLGWRFIRIRGSEYYRNPEKTMERVYSELASHGIEPEDYAENDQQAQNEPELLQRVKACAAKYMDQFLKEIDTAPDIDVITAALSAPEPPKPTQSKPEKPAAHSVPYAKERPRKSVPTSLAAPYIPYEVASTAVPPVFSSSDEDTVVQQSLFDTPSAELAASQVSPKKAPSKGKTAEVKNAKRKENPAQDKGSDFLAALDREKIPYIDNRAQSGIVWVIYAKDYKEIFEKITSESGYSYGIEKRGSIATGNRPAWRVFI